MGGRMKWPVRLAAESDACETTMHEVAILKRTEAFIGDEY
jgi:hypothetical protein